MRVFLVEDDRALSLGIQHALERRGWQVNALAEGEQALGSGLLGQHDLAVFDLGLRRKSGLDVPRTWRTRVTRPPVLLLTVRDPLADRVAAQGRPSTACANGRRPRRRDQDRAWLRLRPGDGRHRSDAAGLKGSP